MKFIKKMFKHSLHRDSSIQPDQLLQGRTPLTSSLQENIQMIKETLGGSSDIIIREIKLGTKGEIHAAIFYTDGLVDGNSVHHFIMKPLMLDMRGAQMDRELSSCSNQLEFLKDFVLAVEEIGELADYETLFTLLLSGDVIILLDHSTRGLHVDMRGWEDRGVTETTNQSVIRGPREAFTETLRTNTAQIRRKIKDPRLWLESRQIGRVTKTDVAVMYIQGIVNDKVVEEVRRRLDRIDIDGILESGYIEELIQDQTYTPFPTVYNTERPDVIAAGLLEGRVAILVDGTPFVLLVPNLFISYFQAAEDYYQRFDISTLLRILRILGFFIALLAPSLYIAVTTFHQELLPTELLISLASQREGVPFPAFVEALLMEVTFEILREAGVRMPKAVGQAVSIVGTLVIGQAAVEAGIVSAAMVIIVSITAISTFVIPSYNMAVAVRMLRFILMGIAASFGLLGVTVGVFALVLHLCSLRSFGVPYMSPFAPMIIQDQKDSIFRAPHWGMFTRPHLISQKNVQRQQNPAKAKPRPPK